MSVYKEIVIIGNGPSAITLSYLLAGNWPYYTPTQPHSNQYLHSLLTQENATNLSLVEQDLEELSNGLHGRSINPVSVLLDQLQHPEADFGVEMPSTLSWKLQENRTVDHIVIGKGMPGGAWHKMHDCRETLTISLSSWMQLPNMDIKEWCSEPRRESRVNLSTVADYYRDYVKFQGLTRYFKNFSTVTSVCFNDDTQYFEVEVQSSNEKHLKYITPKVVLATGNSDKHNSLSVKGENLPFVLHSLNELEYLISENKLNRHSDPILIIGAGLSAADAVIATRFKRIPTVHAFRRHPDDPELIFNQLPENMYPEYHKVHSKMKGKSLPNNGYEPLAMHCVKEIKENKEVVLTNLIGADDTQLTTCITIKVSYVLVLIGYKPDLQFLKPKNLLLNLGVRKRETIHPRHNPIKIDSYTHESVAMPSLYALGPLVGDNFVRFVQGGALAITNHHWKLKYVK